MDEDREEFVDSHLFLGMHSVEEPTRIVCKNFFAARFHRSVSMSLEQVGKCDDIVWRYPRKLQDLYYPFMDVLHSRMRINRLPFMEKDLDRIKDPQLEGVGIHERLLLAMIFNRNGILYTVNQDLLERSTLPVRLPPAGKEARFPKALEKLYQRSLDLRIPKTQFEMTNV